MKTKLNFFLVILMTVVLSACGGSGGDGGGNNSPTPTDPTTPSEGSIRTCTIANGSGLQTYTSGQWGTCLVNTCDTGYSKVGNSCQSDNVVSAPTNLAYPQDVLVFRGQNMIPVVPSADGGTITSFTIQPALPTGLSFNTSTGRISGTALISSTQKTHTVVATGPGGQTSTTVKVEVREPNPSYLSYTKLNPTYVVGQTIENNQPSTDFSAGITGYSVSPSLPTGLILNTSTGIISGTPQSTSADANYVVTASYSGGTVQATISINVVESPSSFSYPQASYNFTANEAFADISPDYSGPAYPAVSFELDNSSAALPDGVLLNSSNGKLYTLPGSYPNNDTPARSIIVRVYVVENPNIFLTTTVSLSVSSAPTTNLSYNEETMFYRKGEVFPANYPTFDGSAPDSYSICLSSSPSTCEGVSCGSTEESCGNGDSKVLPRGVSFSNISGRIVGSSDVLLSETSYIITATYSSGGGGTVSDSITMEFVQELPTFEYNRVNQIVVRKNEPLSNTYDSDDLKPFVTSFGVPITGWVIDKALPTGMNFDGAVAQGLPADASAGGTGQISGTPTILSAPQNYTISACNSDGCYSQELLIGTYSFLSSLTTGKNHSCVVINDDNNSVYCWGANTYGQLGFASSDTCEVDQINYSCDKRGGFVRFANNSKLDNVFKIAAGDNHTCAWVKTGVSDEKGTVYCWGDNSYGQLGQGYNGGSSLYPLPVLRTYDNATAIFTEATEMAIGGNAGCFLQEDPRNLPENDEDRLDGIAFCWGLGYGTTAQLLSGQEGLGFQKISMGASHGCGVKPLNVALDPVFFDGSVHCWGDNNNDKLGSTGGSSSTPVAVTLNSSPFAGVLDLYLGQEHSCATKENGDIYCWGSNTYGQLGITSGIGTSSTFPDPQKMGSHKTTGLFGNGFMTMFSDQNDPNLNYLYTGKTPVLGSVYSSSNQAPPTNIKIDRFNGGTPYNFSGLIMSKGPSAEDFACAVDTTLDYSVHCWGGNAFGQLGDDSTSSSELPVKVQFDY